MKEITYEDWQKNPTPRMLWVWNDDFEEREKKKVVYIIKDDFVSCPVLAVSEEDSSFCIYCCCAEIEEPKKRRMTDEEKQLTKAKEIIENLIDSLLDIDGEQIKELGTVKEAEQFLNREVEG